MAVQLHIAFSSIINGAIVFGGPPFYCAKTNQHYMVLECGVDLGQPDVSRLVDLTRVWSSLGYIDSVENLRNDRIYLFHGTQDSGKL
jgi:hypothetical protein